MSFPQTVLVDLFSKQLPTFLEQIRERLNETTETLVTGLAPTSGGGPIDHCNGINGFDFNQFAKHGGPIPIMGGHTWQQRQAREIAIPAIQMDAGRYPMGQ